MTQTEFFNYMCHNTSWVNWTGIAQYIFNLEDLFSVPDIYEAAKSQIAAMPVEALDMAVRMTPGTTHVTYPDLLPISDQNQTRWAAYPRERALAFPRDRMIQNYGESDG